MCRSNWFLSARRAVLTPDLCADRLHSDLGPTLKDGGVNRFKNSRGSCVLTFATKVGSIADHWSLSWATQHHGTWWKLGEAGSKSLDVRNWKIDVKEPSKEGSSRRHRSGPALFTTHSARSPFREQLAHASLRPAGAPKASTACFRANWLRFRGPTGRPHRLQGIHPLVVFGCVAEGGDKKACFKASKAEGRECSSTASRDSQNSLAAGSSACAAGGPGGCTVGRMAGRSGGRPSSRADGPTDGRAVGPAVGGLAVGRAIGRSGGRTVGWVGWSVGLPDGRSDGRPDGRAVWRSDGQAVGRTADRQRTRLVSVGRPGGRW